ncbi:hypothetical protein KCP78_17430 [Salmonella enterica subsp. enterica]|nr:hypothetical protein KCP78_17430 [Salmonella enterica subsp. enterica]
MRQIIHQKGVKINIITLGSKGSLAWRWQYNSSIPRHFRQLQIRRERHAFNGAPHLACKAKVAVRIVLRQRICLSLCG